MNYFFRWFYHKTRASKTKTEYQKERLILKIQEAKIDDASLVLEFIKKKAKFDAEMSGETREVSTTVEKIKQTLFGLFPFASVIFARSNDNEVLGFALYHKRYSSFSGKPSIWLDDLYVNSTSRSKGVGLELMQSLKHTSKSINASHIAWNASVKNSRGKKFYERFGAELVSTENSALLYRYLIQD